MELIRRTQETPNESEMKKNAFNGFCILTNDCYRHAYTVIKDKKIHGRKDDIHYADLSEAFEINRFGAKFDSILLSRRFLILLTRENTESQASVKDIKKIYEIGNILLEEDNNYPLDTCIPFSFASDNSNGYSTQARVYPHGYLGLQEANNIQLRSEDLALEMLLIKQARINNGE